MTAPQITELSNTQLIADGQDRALMVQQALGYLQDYVGTSWNDHSPSDPGLTILEALAHSIAELSRRLALPVPDLLAIDTTQTAERDIQPYYLAKDLLPTNPITETDHRRHLIDIPGIQQAWLHTEITGATSLYIDLEEAWENRTLADKIELCETVRARYIQERNVNQDLEKITIIKKHKISIKLHLIFNKPENLTNSVAQILHKLQQALAPDVQKQRIDELKRTGLAGDQILDGPWLHNGLITDEALNKLEQQHWLYSSQLLNTLTDIAGLAEVRNIALATAATEPSYDEWRLAVKANHRPSLDIDETLNALTLQIDGQIHPITTTEKQRIKEQIHQATEIIQPQNPAKEVLTEYINGQHQQLSRYASIQHNFPALYQVAQARLERAITQEDAPIMQLKGYLSLFDQILADQYAQLDNLKTALAIPRNPAIERIGQTFEAMLSSEAINNKQIEQFWRDVRKLPITRRSRPITDIAGMHHLIGSEYSRYQAQGFQPIAEPAFNRGQLDRLRRSMAHLLARFAETTLDSNLLRYKPVINNYLEDFAKANNAIHEEGETLVDKLVILKEITDLSRILNNYPRLSRYRCGGYNYLQPPSATAGRTGLTERILAYLGSTGQRQMPIATGNREGIYLLESLLIRPETEDSEWKSDQLYFVIPNWPTRHTNEQYLTLLKAQIRAQSPVHQQTLLIQMAQRDMSLFERLYYAWLNAQNQRPLHIAYDDQTSISPMHPNIATLSGHLRAFTQAPDKLKEHILCTETEQSLQDAINARIPTETKVTGYGTDTLVTLERLAEMTTALEKILTDNAEQVVGLTADDLLFAISHDQIAEMVNPKVIGEAIIKDDFVIGYQPLDRYQPTYPIGTAYINPTDLEHPAYSISIQTSKRI